MVNTFKMKTIKSLLYDLLSPGDTLDHINDIAFDMTQCPDSVNGGKM